MNNWHSGRISFRTTGPVLELLICPPLSNAVFFLWVHRLEKFRCFKDVPRGPLEKRSGRSR